MSVTGAPRAGRWADGPRCRPRPARRSRGRRRRFPARRCRPDGTGSFLSIGSAGSILSIGSVGSILSIGSAGSILSIGSAGSILSIGSSGSIASIGSAYSAGSLLSVLSAGSRAVRPRRRSRAVLGRRRAVRRRARWREAGCAPRPAGRWPRQRAAGISSPRVIPTRTAGSIAAASAFSSTPCAVRQQPDLHAERHPAGAAAEQRLSPLVELQRRARSAWPAEHPQHRGPAVVAGDRSGLDDGGVGERQRRGRAARGRRRPSANARRARKPATSVPVRSASASRISSRVTDGSAASVRRSAIMPMPIPTTRSRLEVVQPAHRRGRRRWRSARPRRRATARRTGRGRRRPAAPPTRRSRSPRPTRRPARASRRPSRIEPVREQLRGAAGREPVARTGHQAPAQLVAGDAGVAVGVAQVAGADDEGRVGHDQVEPLRGRPARTASRRAGPSAGR